MEVLVLGSGTSTGVPLPGCACEVCTSSDPKDYRNRTSILIQTDHGKNILIDTSPDLRQQALTFKIRKIDAVIYTHSHADHILGLEDLRPFNFVHRNSIPIYATENTTSGLKRCFDYIFNPDPDYEGGLLAQVSLTTITEKDAFVVEGVKVQPIPLYHGKMLVLGFRIGNFAYCTDCNQIPESSIEALKGVDTLIIDALRFNKHGKHGTHFTIEESIEEIKKINPKQAYLTHMTHLISHSRDSALLPAGVAFAYDGLKFEISGS